MSETLADFFRTHIELENIASPVEAMNYIQNERNKKSALDPILYKLEKLMLEASENIKPFIREVLSRNVFLYNSEKRTKNLLICFCGRGNRLMMPIPVFLQYINSEIYDVLILKDPSGLCFHSGIPEFGDTLEESVSKLVNLVSLESYHDVITFGTSGGGYASLYVGYYLNAKKAISIGGSHPSKYIEMKDTLAKKKLSGYEFESLLFKKNNKSETNMKIVYSGENYADKKNAFTLSKYLSNIHLIPINGSKSHNVLEYLREKHKLNSLISELLN